MHGTLKIGLVLFIVFQPRQTAGSVPVQDSGGRG